MKKFMIRQGDILIEAAEIPTGATSLKTERKRHVLAYGEATGHAHAAVAWTFNMKPEEYNPLVES